MRKLYTFGDSHSFIDIWKTMKIPNVEIVVNPVKESPTMARFAAAKLSYLNIKNKGVEENDIVCFCFGDMDCRAHFTKSNNFSNYKHLITEVASRYFEAIHMNVQQYENLTTIVFNVVPTAKNFTDVSFAGTPEQRREVVQYMNFKLKQFCEEYNYIFLDVYYKYIDETGFFNPNLKDFSVHIANGIYVEEFLNNLNL